MNDLKKEDLLLYSTYTILYINDVACNSVKELMRYVQYKDKETKKIYGALNKRSFAYFETINKIIGDKSEFLSDIFLRYDEAVDGMIEDYSQSLKDMFKISGIEDYEYFAQLEFTRSITELAIYIQDKIMHNLALSGIKCDALEFYKITEVSRVANNLVKWAWTLMKNPVNVEKEYVDLCVKKVSDLMAKLVSPDLFKIAYTND